MVKHHFINTLDIKDDYSAGKFENDVLELLPGLFRDHQLVIMTGGSGLYFSAIWEGLDEMPETETEIRKQITDELRKNGISSLLSELQEKDSEYFNKVDRKNPQRIIRALEVIRTTGNPYSDFRKERVMDRDFINLKIGLTLPREELYDRINTRMDRMIGKGLFEEAEKLLPYQHLNALQTVGYKEIFGFLNGEYDKEEAVRLLKRNSRRYAKAKSDGRSRGLAGK